MRLVAAAAIVVGGLVHLQLYFDGYRDFPNANLGRSFLLNGFGSALIAIAVVARRDLIVRLAGIGMVVGTLIAFALSRSDRGVFGFTEQGFQPSPQAALTLVAEVVALVALLATFVPRLGAGRTLAIRTLAPLAAAIVIGTVLMGVLWNREPQQSSAAAPAAASPVATAAGGSTPADAPTSAAVTIADFAFGPPEITVAAGTTVTWSNDDSVSHTVDATDDSFVTDPLGEGATFSHTFDTAGTFGYICAIHPSMSGTVVVTG